uniref:BdrB2- n=1 Tax=Borrelia hermsii TaxID=140 RepID=Q9RGA2_BORHE|nr:BdrB2- [Borrelia hermsii]
MSDFNSFLTLSILMLRLFSTVSILLSRSLMSDFNSFLTLSILLSRSLISDFNSFLTLSILLSRSLISDFKLASSFSSLRLKVVSKYSISL